MTTIVNEFGKFRYNRLPMGMCALGDIFQAKVYKLLGDIEGIKTYTDGLLVLSKDYFTKYIEHLRVIFGRLRTSGLKFNYNRFRSGLNQIPYLVYIITR